MDNKVLVSVIIPTYNRKHTLKRCIDSVLNQTYQNVEIVIVDDCSTDGSFEYVAELYGDVEQLIYIQNDKNVGPSAARNIGVLQSHGDYIAFHDSDDIWLPYKLEKQMQAVETAGEDVGLIYSRFSCIWEDGTEASWPPDSWKREWKEGDVFPHLLIYPTVGSITMLMKRELFLEIGGFNEELKALEDYEFTLRVAQYYKFLYIDEVLAVAYDTSGSVGKNNNEHLETQFFIMQKYKTDFARYGLTKEKFFKVLDEAKRHNNIAFYLNRFLHEMYDEEYVGYVKEAVQMLKQEQ